MAETRRPPRRLCLRCGRQFRAPVAAPWERHCSGCRVEPPIERAGGASVVELPPPVPGLTIEAAARAELEAAGCADHALGVVALKLAHELDGSVGVVTMRLAAEYRQAREAALRDAKTVEADVLDLIFREEPT